MLAKVKCALDQILTQSGFKKGPFNIDVLVTEDEDIFVVEIGPRCGGNDICEAIKLRTGVDLVSAAVECCLQHDFSLPLPITAQTQFSACYVVHTFDSGSLDEIYIDPCIEPSLVKLTEWLREGEPVVPFTRSDVAVANAVLKFASREEMDKQMAMLSTNIHAVLRKHNS